MSQVRYYIDIQRELPIRVLGAGFTDEDEASDTYMDTLSLDMGWSLNDAFYAMVGMCDRNFNKGGDSAHFRYIRLRMISGETEVVLTKRSPSRQGDW